MKKKTGIGNNVQYNYFMYVISVPVSFLILSGFFYAVTLTIFANNADRAKRAYRTA